MAALTDGTTTVDSTVNGAPTAPTGFDPVTGTGTVAKIPNNVSTSAPAASPVSTVSSAPAATMVATKIAPTLNQASTDIATQNANRAASTAAGYLYNTPVVGSNGQTTNYSGPQSGLAAYQASMGVAPTPGTGTSTTSTPSPAPSNGMTPAESAIVNTPDAGHQFYYDSQGNQVQLPIGSTPPAGYTTTNPKAGPSTSVVNSVVDTVGNTYKQFSDGTYGVYDVTGNYQGPTTQTGFSNAQNAASVTNSLQQVMNGTYPLTADQQAQIAGIQAQFAQLIQQQQTANANFTGGTTVAENLYGMGNSIAGLGEIKGTVDAGLAKIADLNSKMVSAVAQMRSGFQTDNLNMLKSAFDIYNTTATNRQNEIDKIQAAQAAATKAAVDRQNAIRDQISSLAADASKNGASPSVVSAITSSTSINAAIAAAGDSLQTATGPLGDYLQYKRDTESQGLTPQDYTTWTAAQDAKKAKADAAAAYAKEYATKSADALFTNSDKNQEALEQQGRAVILKETSNRSGGLGLQDAKVNQAIHLKALFDQYASTQMVTKTTFVNGRPVITKVPETVYNIPSSVYTELAMGVASLVSGTNTVAEGTINNIKQATAAGSIGKALTYATGTPYNGSTQAILKQLKDSVDRQGITAQSERQTYIDNLQSLLPTDLSSDRKAALLEGSGLNMYTTAKDNVDNYVKANPDQAETIAKLYEVPGTSDQDILDYISQTGGSTQ